MNNSFFEKFTIERNLLYIIIAAVLIAFAVIFYLFYSHFSKGIEIVFPNGREELRLGETYKIKWSSQGIDRVGIVLFKGAEPKWIAKNIVAENEEYDWKIQPGQEYRDDYWVAIFEYPWQEGNIIDYSDGAFAVVFPELGSCDSVSLQNEWPYLPNSYPDLRMVFITEEKYKGDLGGLIGADEKCQEEAKKLGYGGDYIAFLGGDSDEETAVKRLENSKRSTEGYFVDALAEAELLNGDTCHRVLGKSFAKFVSKLSASKELNQERLREAFYQKLNNVWLGRISAQSKKNCEGITSVIADPYTALAEKYTFTTTCENWTRGEHYVQGYPVPVGQSKPPFPTCYTPQGKSTDAAASGGLGVGETQEYFAPNQAKYCDSSQRLICVQE